MRREVTPGLRSRLPVWLTRSALPYLTSAFVTLVVAKLLSYFYRGDFTLKGQPLGILITLGMFPITLALWSLFEGRPTRSRWLWAAFGGLTIAWVAHMSLMVSHGDDFAHPAWLYVPLLLLVVLKVPSAREAWQSLTIFAWALALLFVYAWVGEALGFQAPYPVPPTLHPWESANYWLPLDGAFGFHGRWPGPFTHNTRAGLAAAFVVVIGAGRRTRSTFPLVVIGLWMMAFIMVRSGWLAIIAGVLVLVLFARVGPLARVPVWLRLAGLMALVAGAAWLFFFAGAGLTGRASVWPAFLDLWRSSPLTGVGRTGIMSPNNPAAIYEDGLNIFIDELARFGLLGFITQFAALGVGVAIAVRGAIAGFAGPLAVIVTYLVASQADVHNDWIHPTFYVLVLFMAVTASAQWLEERRVTPSDAL